MGTKMGPSYPNLFVGYTEHQFFIQYNGPKPELYCRYIDDCVGATSSTREELNQFVTAVNSFRPALKYTWKFPILLWPFYISKFPSKTTVYAPVCTTSPQILIVICCIHLHIHHMSRISFLILSFLDFGTFVVRTLFSQQQRKCAISSTNVAIVRVVQKEAIIAPNKLIGSQHCKRLRRRIIIEFHSPSHFTLTRSKIKSIILKNFKLLQNDPDTH